MIFYLPFFCHRNLSALFFYGLNRPAHKKPVLGFSFYYLEKARSKKKKNPKPQTTTKPNNQTPKYPPDQKPPNLTSTSIQTQSGRYIFNLLGFLAPKDPQNLVSGQWLLGKRNEFVGVNQWEHLRSATKLSQVRIPQSIRLTKWSYWQFSHVPVFCFLKMLLNIPANIASAYSFDEVVIDLENWGVTSLR